MRKTILLITFLVGACLVGVAQKGFKKGDKLLNIGIGVNSYYSGGIPLGVSFEAAINNEISIGGSVDYLSHKYKYYDGSFYKFTAMYISARGSYHLNELLNIETDKADLYVGPTIGYRTFSWNDSYYGSVGGVYGSGIYLGAFAGGKYFFNPKIGAFAELGAIGSTNAKVGVAFKL